MSSDNNKPPQGFSLRGFCLQSGRVVSELREHDDAAGLDADAECAAAVFELQ